MPDQPEILVDRTGTRTIRVFVSSTFRDMHAERDYLSRIVFPELRSRCRRRGAEFVGIDLRWGVTEEEARRQGALNVCLEEIERCRPFFLCLLGERFGWVPPPEEVERSVFERALSAGLGPDLAAWYELDETSVPPRYRLRRDRPLPESIAEALAGAWERQDLPDAGKSITAREVLRAAFSEDAPATHSFFYLRRPGLALAPGFPEALVSTFAEADPLRRRQLDELLARVRAAADRFTVRDYDVAFAGLRLDPSLVPEGTAPHDRDRLAAGVTQPAEWEALGVGLRRHLERYGTVALHGVEALGEAVLDDLWLAIESELAAGATEPDPHERERAFHEAFLAERTRLFLGRTAALADVLARLLDPDDRRPLVVTGEAGSGKSALLACCALACRARSPERVVLPYFIGAAPGSTALAQALASLCRAALRACGLPDSLPADPDELRREWLSYIERAAAQRPVVLLIDAVNQLHSTTARRQLGWIPATLPVGVSLVVSTVPGPELDVLRTRVPADHVIGVPPLSSDDRRNLVELLLESRHKRLSKEQLDRLLDDRRRPESGLPLYLLVAVEELSLFGSFVALDERIERLPPTLHGLFDQVLMRLEQDHGRELVAPVNAWLAASRASLVEADVLELLARAGQPRRDRWVRLYRALEAYLRPIEEESRGGALDFFHQQLRIAACRRYLQMPDPDAAPSSEGAAAHRTLADYFAESAHDPSGAWTADRPVALGEIVFHEARAGRFADLAGLLCDLDFIAIRMRSGQGYSLLIDYALAESVWPGSLEQARVERLAEYTRALLAHAGNPAEVALPEPPPRRDPEIGPESNRPTDQARVTAFRRFATTHFDRLVAGEEPVVQMAHNASQFGAVSEEADRWLREGLGPKGPWLRRLTRPLQPQAAACLMTLRGHRDLIRSLAMTPDGSRALTGSLDGTIRVWDLSTGESRAFVAHPRGVDAVAMAADGRRAVSAGIDAEWYEDLRVWDLETGESRIECHGICSVGALALTPDGRRAASGHSNGEIRLWDLERGTGGTLRRHLAGVRALAMTPDARWIVSGGGDRGLIVWDTFSSESRELAATTRDVAALAMTPDGRIVAAADEYGVTVWDIASGEELLPVANGRRAVAITPDGLRLVCGGDALTAWDLDRLASRRLGDPLGTHALALSADGSRAVSVGYDQCGVWDVDSPAVEEDDRGSGASHVYNWECAPGGRTAYLNQADGLEVLDLVTGETRSMKLGTTGMEGAMALIPPGDRLLRGGSLGIQIIDLDAGRVDSLSHSDQTEDVVRWLAVTPDGRRAVSAGDDCLLRQWDLHTGESRELGVRRERVHALTVAPDGRRAATGHGLGVVRLWDLETGDGRSFDAGDATPVVRLADDGRRLAAVTLGGRLLTWDLVFGTRRVELEDAGRVMVNAPDGTLLVAAREKGPVRWLAPDSSWREIGPNDTAARALLLTPDGRYAMVGGLEGGARIWELDSGKLVACDRGGRWVRRIVLPRCGLMLDGSGADSFAVQGWTNPASVPVLAVRLWQFEAFGVAGRLSLDLTVLCPECGQRVAPAGRSDSSAMCPACGARLRLIEVPGDVPVLPPASDMAVAPNLRVSLTPPPPSGAIWRPRRDSRPGLRMSRAAAARPALEPGTSKIPSEEKSRPPRQITRRPRTQWVLLPYRGPSGRPWRELRTPARPPR